MNCVHPNSTAILVGRALPQASEWYLLVCTDCYTLRLLLEGFNSINWLGEQWPLHWQVAEFSQALVVE